MGAAAKGSFPEFEVPNGSAYSDLQNDVYFCSKIFKQLKIVPELVSVGSHAPPSFGISGGA